MDAFDGLDSGWQQRGSWTVPAVPPTVVSVTPNSGSGSSQTFSFVYADTRGYASVGSVLTIINSSLSVSGACYFLYYPGPNVFYLANDAVTAWLGPAALGTTGSLQNSQCTIDAGSSSASGSGTNLTVNLALSFKPSFGGAKNVYMDAVDGYILDAGWQQKGTWTVPTGQQPDVHFPVLGPEGLRFNLDPAHHHQQFAFRVRRLLFLALPRRQRLLLGERCRNSLARAGRIGQCWKPAEQPVHR
jgi:hypothetical protein